MMRDALTPMMQQYRRVRGSIPADTLLLFRLGDFYELFFEDAKEAAVLLNVALTKRNGVPMCGMPYHAAQTYIAKLIKAGRRVAICDQTSEPQPGKIVSRDITQIISAGTVSDFDLLEAKRANYLGAVYADGGTFGFAYADLTTGEFRLTQLQDRQSLLDELARVSPSELLTSSEQKDQLGEIDHTLEYDSYAFLPEQAIFTLCEHFKTKSLDGFGCGDMPRAVAAAGAIVHYLKHQLRRNTWCSTPRPRGTLNSLNHAAHVTPVCWQFLIARLRRWAVGDYVRGFCSRCAICTSSSGARKCSLICCRKQICWQRSALNSS